MNKTEYVHAVHEKLGMKRFTVLSWNLLGKNKRGWTEVKGEPKEAIPITPVEVIPIQTGCCSKSAEKTERQCIIDKLNELKVSFRKNASTEKLKEVLDENTKQKDG